MFGGFNSDPFGLNSMMSNHFMMDPFAPPQHRNGGGNRHQQPGNAVAQRNHFDPFGAGFPFHHHHSSMMMSNPFAMMNQMMGGGGHHNMFEQMGHGNVIHADPNSQVFSSSSVMTYSNDGGQPKIFQQSSQTRQGPGGVKETRQMIRDTARGIEKVSVGHHIGDRAHVIERQKVNGSDIEEIVNLENLDDDEVTQFNHEFESKIRNGHGGHHNNGHHRSHPHSINQNVPLAIEGHSSSKKDRSDRKSKPSNPSKRSDKHI